MSQTQLPAEKKRLLFLCIAMGEIVGIRCPSVATGCFILVRRVGEIVGILGPSGAGKSTLISMLIGHVAPTSGTIRVAGFQMPRDKELVYPIMGICPQVTEEGTEDEHDPPCRWHKSEMIKESGIQRSCAYPLHLQQYKCSGIGGVQPTDVHFPVSQHDLLWKEASCEEHLYFYGRLKSIPEENLPGAVHEALRSVSLTQVAGTPVRLLSGGMKRRLSVAISVMGGPSVVFMVSVARLLSLSHTMVSCTLVVLPHVP